MTEALRSSYPIAEATLLKVSIVSIDLTRLHGGRTDAILPPQVFQEMEKAETFDVVLPGANVIRRDKPNDTPIRFFREASYDAFNAKIDENHETLLETVRALENGSHDLSRINCPIRDCIQKMTRGVGCYDCACGEEKIFESDAFRFAERFSEVSSNGEAHGEVRHVLEVVALMNILRFFADGKRKGGFNYLRDCVFVLDGPLALFGHPAWLSPYIRDELVRINLACRAATGQDIAVIGYEKTGEFVNHFERLDFSEASGPRHRFAEGTVIAPDAAYINENIALRDKNAKPHGADTYFGRKILYKTRSGDHSVITTAMVNDASRDFTRNDTACYPRLGDILNVLDYLSTYLYRDGFMPLVRANAHAAIPLRRGSDIIRSLFGDRSDGSTPPNSR